MNKNSPKKKNGSKNIRLKTILANKNFIKKNVWGKKMRSKKF